MKPTRRLRELWNWLPVFRAVAETQHLPTAAKALFISPASLSRTIGLLEENIGSLLFDRVGRNLQLNATGAILLDAVRDGMRAIDEGVSTVTSSLWTGQMCVWAERDFAALFLLPLLGKLQQEGLEPILRSGDSLTVVERILRGQIDLALLEQPPIHKQLQVDKLLEIPYALYCSQEHPLAQRDQVSLQELRSYCFVVTSPAQSETSRERYPPEFPRTSIVKVEDMNMAAEACSKFAMIASLPVITASTTTLHKLPLDVLPTTALYAVYRKPVSTHPRTELLLKILQQQIRAK